jgi:hypothetical protein
MGTVMPQRHTKQHSADVRNGYKGDNILVEDETALYIADMTAELAQMAKSCGLYLLYNCLNGAKLQAEVCCFHRRQDRLADRE